MGRWRGRQVDAKHGILPYLHSKETEARAVAIDTEKIDKCAEDIEHHRDAEKMAWRTIDLAHVLRLPSDKSRALGRPLSCASNREQRPSRVDRHARQSTCEGAPASPDGPAEWSQALAMTSLQWLSALSLSLLRPYHSCCIRRSAPSRLHIHTVTGSVVAPAGRWFGCAIRGSAGGGSRRVR